MCKYFVYPLGKPDAPATGVFFVELLYNSGDSGRFFRAINEQ